MYHKKQQEEHSKIHFESSTGVISYSKKGITKEDISYLKHNGFHIVR